MWGGIAHLLIALPVAAALQLLIPRRFARAWAVWLLVCLIAGSLQWIGQGVYSHYHPDRLFLSTKGNQLEFQKDQAGEVTGVVVDNPPENFRASGSPQRSVSIAVGTLGLAFVILLLLLRAEPVTAFPAPTISGSGRGVGLSLQLLGLATLVVSLATAIASRSGDVNVLGVVVMASGYYVSRGSRLAGKWALVFMALLAGICLLFA
jgi:hypothetical protein